MKFSKAKLIAYCAMVALLSSLIIGLLGFSNTTKNVEDVKNKLLEKHVENNINLTMKYINESYGTLIQGNGTLLDSSGNSIEGTYGVVDTVLEHLGDQATIFVKVNDDFKRISTNIMANENERATSTYLGREHMAYETVMKGETYIGEAVILDENYYTAYQPIKDVNENVIGLLFVGTPTKELDDIIHMHDSKMNKMDKAMIVLRAISLGSLIAFASVSIMNTKKKECKIECEEEFNKNSKK